MIKRRIDDDGRECTKCGEYKPWSGYGSVGASKLRRATTNATAHRPNCKKCETIRRSESRRRLLAERRATGGSHIDSYIERCMKEYTRAKMRLEEARLKVESTRARLVSAKAYYKFKGT